MRTQLLIPAAGMGTRLGASQPKALVNLAGTPLLVHTLRNFQSLDLIRDCLITVSASAREAYEKCLAAAFPDHAFELVDGGNERQDSVLNGLAALHRDTELVIIHDAARPFAPADAIRGSIDAAGEYGGGAWTVKPLPGDPTQGIDINDFRISLGVEWSSPSGLNGFIEGGYVFKRRLVYTVPYEEFSLADAWMVRAGFSF